MGQSMTACGKRAVHDDRKGAAAVELAMALPLLVLFFAIMVDFARVFYYQEILSNCARNGAVFATDASIQQKSGFDELEQVALAAAGPLTGEVTVESNTVAETQDQVFVDVTASYTYVPILRIPGLVEDTHLSRTVRMRVPSLAQTE
jgi:Flp pilus assembly protein TadG